MAIKAEILSCLTVELCPIIYLEVHFFDLFNVAGSRWGEKKPGSA